MSCTQPRMALKVLVIVCAVGLSEAQSAAPTFEVASIRPHPLPPGAIRPSVWMPTFQCDPTLHCGVVGSRFREMAVSLADLIIDAYKVKESQILGLPGWADSRSNLYDVDAKIGEATSVTADEARLMLRSLLADLFQLRVHQEKRELPVYALVLAKSGAKLVPNQARCSSTTNRRSGAAKGTGDGDAAPAGDSGYLLPWAFYAEQLSKRAGRLVIDETGMNGAGYCTSDGRSPTLAVLVAASNGTSLFTAIEEEWGVKLEPRRATVDVVVVDHAERPSEN